jgi:hypothetical protein
MSAGDAIRDCQKTRENPEIAKIAKIATFLRHPPGVGVSGDRTVQVDSTRWPLLTRETMTGKRLR